jgi:hypothetical protein
MSGVSHRWPAAIFPSMEAWEAFYNGPTYQGLKSIRDECSSARLVSVLSASAECTDCARESDEYDAAQERGEVRAKARPGGEPLDRSPRQGVLDPEGRIGRRYGAHLAGRTGRDSGRPLQQSENGWPSCYGRDCTSQGDRECLGEGMLFPSEHASLLPDRLNRLDLLSTRAASSSADVTRRARPEQRRRCSGWQGRRVRLR